MTAKDGSKCTIEKIDICRDELNNLISTEQLPSEHILIVSRKLDELILNYYMEDKASKR